MLATFHWTWDDGEEGAVPCNSYGEIEANVELSRKGIEGGSERGFYIEWHSQE